VLKAVEQAKIRWPKRGEEYTTYLKNVIKTHLPMRSADDDESAEAAYDERRKDHLSHFVLRLAYCKRCGEWRRECTRCGRFSRVAWSRLERASTGGRNRLGGVWMEQQRRGLWARSWRLCMG
jgi:hypothetical protein